MEIEMRKALLKDALTLCVPMRQEVTARCTEDGLRIYAVSTDNTCLMDIVLSKEAVSGLEDGNAFGIDVKEMLDVLRTAGDTVRIELTDRMIVRSGGMRHTVPMIAPEGGEMRIPVMDTDSEAILGTAPFVRFLSAVPDKKGVVKVAFTEGGLVLTAETSHSIRSAELTVPKEDCVLCEGSARSSYGANYLIDFIGSVPKGAELDMTMSDNFPLFVSFEGDGMKAKYVLAPRIEDED